MRKWSHTITRNVNIHNCQGNVIWHKTRLHFQTGWLLDKKFPDEPWCLTLLVKARRIQWVQNRSTGTRQGQKYRCLALTQTLTGKLEQKHTPRYRRFEPAVLHAQAMVGTWCPGHGGHTAHQHCPATFSLSVQEQPQEEPRVGWPGHSRVMMLPRQQDPKLCCGPLSFRPAWQRQGTHILHSPAQTALGHWNSSKT